MIKNFEKFISEKISVLDSDSPSIASKANSLNKIEDHIKEFNNKKTELQNIYLTSVDEKDLISKLSARKYINQVNTKSQMNFDNPLLAKFANVCDLRKQISDLQKEVENINKSITDKESSIKTNPSSKDSVMEDIKAKRTDIDRLKAKIQDVKNEADRLERLTVTSLQDMQNEIIKGTREVRLGRQYSSKN